jgi:CBS domain-containing protein
MARATVKEYMTTNVVGAHPEASFKEVVELMTIYDVSGVPVIDAEGGLLGLVTEADLMSKEVYTCGHRRRPLAFLTEFMRGRKPAWLEKAEARCAKELMTADVQTVGPDEPLRTAARIMLRKGIKRLPVVEAGKVVGIISRHDVVSAFDRPDATLAEAVERFLAQCLFVPPEASITVTVNDGVVTLEGSVHYQSDRRVAEALTASMDGVVGVDNLLHFREPDAVKEATG